MRGQHEENENTSYVAALGFCPTHVLGFPSTIWFSEFPTTQRAQMQGEQLT
jgi:hypothetical protein